MEHRILFHEMNIMHEISCTNIMHETTQTEICFINDLHNSIMYKINLTLTYNIEQTRKQFFCNIHSPRRNLKRNGIGVHQTCHECTNHDTANRTKHKFHLFNVILANCNCRGGIDTRNACYGLFR